MSRILEPASDRQMTYLDVLQRKLSNLLEEGSSISDDLERVAASSLSKREAGKLIDTLIQAINRLGGNEDTTVTPIRRSRDDSYAEAKRKEKEDRARLKAELDAKIQEYDREQAIQFGVVNSRYAENRPPPEGSNFLKVWKQKPNHGYNDNYGPGRGKMCVSYGWVWECTHPSHLGKGGPGSKSGRVSGGSVTRGYEGTIEGAERHWWKFHAKD